ncbi:protein phosphatase Slingshot homolog 2 isoform X2 [Kryptolebias marmoratus]|uniref:protein-serine/threonine phosphatase n=1 Tax=Kryptolebias marmoratus TaxID=37003 RepID=A0A3Q3BKY1_KRYMA|nr:protein phosphatase Slingshot homolog 2 isoform X2 [Kryptolebias marmoratus]
MALVTVQRSPTPSTTSSPCVSESGSGEDDHRSQPRSISESFLTVKGAALFLPRGKSPTPNSAPRLSQRRNKHTGDLQKHLQTMFTVLRPEDTIRLAVRLESAYPQVTRYMVVVSTNGRQDTEESLVLGMDFLSSDSCCTVGLVLPLWSDTLIHLDGDGGFSVSTVNRVHVFKPVSVQAMWSALQSLHKACEVARCHNYYPGSLFLTWVSYYQSRVSSSQFCINEWNAMKDVESHRANSPILFTDLPTERERTERLIKMRLREIMMQKDLENVTSKEIRTELEMQMACNLREFKEFIDNEMIVILGQMDSPTEIFDHVFLGSEWNASNLEELQNSGVRYILNVTREIDNFFPGMFEYHNIRVYDEEATNLLEYWNDTYKFITKAKKAGVKCLVHCKMGVSRSASTVIAYAMKEYGWDLDTAFDYVKERRAVTKPNPSFMKQLEEYQGILLASKQRHNKLWRSHSDSDLSDRPESMCKRSSPSLVRADSHNNNTTSLHHFLGVAVLQALVAEPERPAKSNGAHAPVSLPDGVGESEVQGEVRPDCEGAVPLVLPRPRAATVIPEERLNSSASVAVTVPVALPHPPPSLLILPPTPELRRAHRGPPTHLSISVPECKPEELNASETCSSGEISPLTLGSSDSDLLNQAFLDLTSDKHGALPLALAAALKDDNNNPSELQAGSPSDSRGEADCSSNHSADSIDFFTAREKFLGLAQDSREQRTPLSPEGEAEDSEEEEQETSPVKASLQSDTCDRTRPTHNDNGVSVRHIVIEIEAISQSSSSPLTASSSSSSLPSSSPSPQTVQSDHQEEAEDSKDPPGSSAPPPQPPSDWAAGSVRRATEQLELKLRQEQDVAASQRSPLHSPGTEQPPVRLTQCSQSPDPPHTAEHGITQGETAAGSAEPKDGEKHTGSQMELRTLDSSGTDNVQDLCYPQNSHLSQATGAMPKRMYTSDNGEAVTSSLVSANWLEESSLDTSAQSHSQGQPPRQTLQSLAASHQMALDGATVQESDTDEGPDARLQGRRPARGPDCDVQSRLVHSSQELERIQHTLRELQAFLQEGVRLEDADRRAQEPEQPRGLRDTMDTEPGHCKGSSSDQNPPGRAHRQQLRDRQEGRAPSEPTGWHRTVELEARLRQAGLTPPSLMKRSASLAKLDCLELSANDLSDLDLDLELDLKPQTRSAASSHSQNPSSSSSSSSSSLTQSHSDDTWKKQKVLNLNSFSDKTGLSLNGTSSSSSSSSSTQEEKSEGSGSDAADGHSSSAASASRQQGRGHSSRRSRKASAERKQRPLLYNTM